MAEVQLRHMTADEFLGWDPGDDERYELVDGVPRMMTGARVAHDRIVRRALTAFERALAGKPCEPFTADIAVKIPSGQVRRPDMTIDCGAPSDDQTCASEPVLIVEVLSRSTQHDLIRKLIEYKSLPTIRYILTLDPDRIAATFHERIDQDRWRESAFVGPETILAFDAIHVTLPLGIFYEPPP
jgi:Uma2 family endonuclease